MDFKNYWIVKHFSFKYYKYVYIDLNTYKADDIFYKYHLPVKFTKSFCHTDHNFALLVVKIRKKDEATFIKCMEELKTKLLILCPNEYEDICKEMSKVENRPN